MLTAVILSGGRSSRMGTPKALVPYRGRPFLAHLLHIVEESLPSARPETAGKPGIGDTRVVLGAHVAEISGALDLVPPVLIVNEQWQQGQLSSIQAAIRSLPAGTSDGIVLFLVDHPLISADLVRKLVAEFYRSGKPIVAPTFRSRRGHPVIFAASLYPELLAAPAGQGARAVVWAHAADVLEVPTEEEGILLNLNDPEAMRRLLD